MSRIKAAIRASAKARRERKHGRSKVECFATQDCPNDAGHLVDLDGWPCCKEHGGTNPKETK